MFSYETRLGEAALIPSGLRCCLGRRMGLLRCDPTKVDSRFLLYAWLGPGFQATIRRRTVHGSTVDRLPLEELGDFLVELPSLSEQRAIAHILGTLDDKIELNRRMNETLEALARAIFKSWFVDFDPVRAKMAGRQPVGMDAEIAALFPDRMQASESGEIPAGWQAGTLDSFFTVGLGGAWGEDERSDRASECVRCLRGIDCHELAEGKLPEVPVRWVSPGQAGDRRLQEGTILVEGSGSFCGRSFCWHPSFAPLIGDPVVYSNFCKRLDPKCSPAQAAICWLQMRRAYDSGELQAFRTGTAFPNLDVHGLLANLSVVLPSVPIAQAFNNLFLLTRRTDLLAQSRTLAALRDTLLPKLLSGELRIPEAEKLVESAT